MEPEPRIPEPPTSSSLRLHHLCASLLDSACEGSQLVLGELHLGGALQSHSHRVSRVTFT